MNKIIFLLFFGFFVTFSLSETRAFNIVNNTSLATGAQCSGANVTIREYFNTPFQPRDEFTSSEFIQLQPVVSPTITDPAQTTRIEIYNPSGMINCGDMNNWIYPSIAIPANKTIPAINTVVSVAKWPSDLCRITSLPATRDDIIAQFIFVNAYRRIDSWLWAGTSWSVGVTLPVASNILLPIPTNYSITPAYIPSNNVQFEQPECLNIQAAWCWDNIVDAANGEQCDLGAQNGAVWSACSVNCTNIVGPACIPGTVSWVQSAPISAATAGLCPVGQTVGGFTSTLAGTLTTYTWSCNGSAVGGLCAATYDSPPLPYSACIVGNPAADCNTNTYATQAACLIANPVGSGRTCYFNDIVSCNATRATQCPGWGGLTCTPGNFTRDAGGVVPAPLTVVTPGLCPVGEIVGNFTDITNGNLHRYAWSCNGIIAWLACTAFYSTGWGWGGGSCQIGSITGVQTTPITISTPWLCAAGLWSVSNFTSTTAGTTTTYTWSCGGVSGCSTTYTTTWGWWTPTPTPTPTTIRTVPGSSSYCGNGIIERPNMLGQYESCDIVAPWCASCNIASTNPGSIPPWNLTITTPGSTSININAYRLIIWDQVPVFSVGDSIVFETTTPMYLQNKTATITNNSSLINGTTISKTINNGIGGPIQFEVSWTRTYDNSGNLLTITYNETRFPNTLKLFDGSELQWFKGDTNVIAPVGYKDTIISNPTYRGQGIYASIAYLEAPFSVRVSKSIISNTAGWSAFIGSFLWNNVNTVVNDFLNALKSGNFTTSTVNASLSYALSSATKSISDNNISEIITSGGQNEEWKISQSSINTSGIYMPIDIASVSDLVSKSVPLGDNESVRVFKNGDVSISGNIDLSGVKTIIVENGNLIINNDIRYADKTSSYAWIIKNGNVIITNAVGNIAGMYITLAGAIVSNGISTSNRLAVDGSLYGNTSDLVNNRSYVRGQTDSTALNVGVVINYSNRAIAYPPPFFTRFLEQYSLQRVAR